MVADAHGQASGHGAAKVVDLAAGIAQFLQDPLGNRQQGAARFG